MSWAIGWDDNWKRDIGYGVPATCDHPECSKKIDRGLSHVCGGEPYGGEKGCGLYFCGDHLWYNAKDGDPQMCQRCCDEEPQFDKKPDTREWVLWKLTDESWHLWRVENMEQVRQLADEYGIDLEEKDG